MFHDLAPGKHLLFDNTVWADTYRLRRVIHQPRLDPAEPVMMAEEPWEGAYVTPLHVEYDAPPGASGGRFRMWYQAHDPEVEEQRKALKTSTYGNVGPPQPIYLAYAESADGVRWRRGKFNLHEHPVHGSPNGILFGGYSYVAGNTIVDRADLPNHGPFPPEERYVLANCEWFSEQVGGVILAYSPDGIHWRYPETPGSTPDTPADQRFKPLMHGESDTWNSLCWNAQRRVWMLYMRGWHSAAVGWPNGKGNPRRRVNYAQSTDLRNWTEPQCIYTPDELDTNDFYGFQVFRYADYYLAQVWRYDDDGDETIEIELAWSHDGVRWQRLPERPRFIPTGRPTFGETYMIIPAQQPVQVGDELHLYWTAHYHPHSVSKFGSTAHRGKLRLDGFLSLNADARMGNLITRPFVVGEPITINAAVRGGEIAAELVEPYWHDPEGKPIDGFRAADFDVFSGDSVRHALSWRGKSDLGALRGRRVMLRLALRHAELYSLTL